MLALAVNNNLKADKEGMDGLDRIDQYRETGAGYASKAHYKTWYKTAFFTILEFMVLNSLFT